MTWLKNTEGSGKSQRPVLFASCESVEHLYRYLANMIGFLQLKYPGEGMALSPSNVPRMAPVIAPVVSLFPE